MLRMNFNSRGFAKDRKRLCAALLSLFFVASGAAAYAQAEKQTVIQVQIDEMHDRLGPEPLRDVEWVEKFTITLTGNNKVIESQKNTPLGSAEGAVSARRAAELAQTSQRDGALGQKDAKVVWQVLGPRRLRRIATGVQFIVMFDIEIDQGDNCHIDAKYLLQRGFDDVVMTRADTGELTHFTLPRVVSASCSIQSS
jgi:hypothetical protein